MSNEPSQDAVDAWHDNYDAKPESSFNKQFTEQGLAELGYVLGLGTLREAALAVSNHYDCYFLIEDAAVKLNELDALVETWRPTVDEILTSEDKARIDEQMAAAMGEPAAEGDIEFSETEDFIDLNDAPGG